MDRISPVAGNVGAGLSQETFSATAAQESIRQLRQTLAKAASVVNSSGLIGAGREVTYTVDATTKVPVVKVVDTESKEVVAQWPPEYLLRLAEELKSSGRNS